MMISPPCFIKEGFHGCCSICWNRGARSTLPFLSQPHPANVLVNSGPSDPKSTPAINVEQPTKPQSNTGNWANLLKDGVKAKKLELQYLEPEIRDGKTIVRIPSEVIEQADPRWNECLVGNFVEQKRHFHAVNNIAYKIWESEGLVEVLSHENGLYFFRFCSHAARRAVLEAGPWLFAGRPIILQLWHPKQPLTKEPQRKIPLWVKFYNVPLSLLSPAGFSYVASTIGRPLHADSLTEEIKIITFAKICVG